MEKAIRILAGSMVLISISLAHWVSPWFLLWTAFVGVNLIQSALTGFCPGALVLRKLGLEGACPCERPQANTETEVCRN